MWKDGVLELFEQQEAERIEDDSPYIADARAARTGAFTDNMKLPLHRWFRYSAGFSADWVESVVRQHDRHDGLLFDPFSGSGTALLAAQSAGLRSVGAEAHPFVVRIAQAKLAWDETSPPVLRERAAALLERAHSKRGASGVESPLLLKCYSHSALEDLEALRQAFLDEPAADAATPLLWLAITAILRECSGVGTAQWQYILPNKSKARVVRPFDAFERRIEMFASDMSARRVAIKTPAANADIFPEDARNLAGFSDLAGKVTLVVTSPPYPNNYDYADATRLEMTFWQEIKGWSDLQKTVRHKLIRSCSQHSAAEKLQLEALLSDTVVSPIRDELSAVCNELAAVRETKGGKKTYHTWSVRISAIWAICGKRFAPCARTMRTYVS
jgi:hypothetical protein